MPLRHDSDSPVVSDIILSGFHRRVLIMENNLVPFYEIPRSANAGAVPQRERIVPIDVLRGFALLGILVMNIQSFAMIGIAYIFPYSYGDMTGANYWVWYLSHIFADQKFMSIFSMLFG